MSVSFEGRVLLKMRAYVRTDDESWEGGSAGHLSGGPAVGGEDEEEGHTDDKAHHHA